MSLSSSIITCVTAYRNPNGSESEWKQIPRVQRLQANSWKRVVAEVGYIAIIPFAIIETALSAIAKIFSSCIPIGKENHIKMTKWLENSAFSIPWAIANIFANLLMNDMFQIEQKVKSKGLVILLCYP